MQLTSIALWDGKGPRNLRYPISCCVDRILSAIFSFRGTTSILSVYARAHLSFYTLDAKQYCSQTFQTIEMAILSNASMGRYYGIEILSIIRECLIICHNTDVSRFCQDIQASARCVLDNNVCIDFHRFTAALRFLLGLFEAGLYPGITFYLSW